jgi:hypothetical protein
MASVEHVVTSRSNHYPIVINMKQENRKPVKLPLKVCEREASLSSCVEQA